MQAAEPAAHDQPVKPAEPAAPASSYGVVYSIKKPTWVYEKADVESTRLGYLMLGEPVALRAAQRTAPIAGCWSGFYQVEPTGFVCAGPDTTQDADHPVVAAMREAKQAADRAYPFHYGLSLGGPMYNKLPDRRTHELVMMRYPNTGKRVDDWARSFLDMDAEAPIQADSEIPSFLRDGRASPNSSDGFVRRSIPHSSLIAYTRAFEYDGRVWVLAEDLSVVPADRIVAFRRTGFRGAELGGQQQLPLAWACRAERRKLRPGADGSMQRTGDSWAPRELIRLSGSSKVVHQETYLESADGSWAAAANVCTARRVEKVPDGIGPNDPWIFLSVKEGTLVAYRGAEPVYATLQSPGRGGTHRGKGDVRAYTTPLGSFFINWKERWATLSPDPGAPKSFWISDAPAVQYFDQPYALHGAYWHESFGVPMSAGCPNLPPVDAVWLLDFTEPRLPDGWQAVGPTWGRPGTMVVVGP